jgi:hypothetical protein
MRYKNFYKPDTMKRNTITVIIGLILSTFLAGAQNPGQERLNSYKIAFLTSRLKFTPSEAERFWPVYNEFQEKKLEIQQERVKLNMRFNQEGSSMTDEQLITLGDKLIELEVAETELTMKFHQTLKAVLPPVKIIRLYQAENQYRQQLLKELQERREQRVNPGPPPGQRNQ